MFLFGNNYSAMESEEHDGVCVHAFAIYVSIECCTAFYSFTFRFLNPLDLYLFALIPNLEKFCHFDQLVVVVVAEEDIYYRLVCFYFGNVCM